MEAKRQVWHTVAILQEQQTPEEMRLSSLTVTTTKTTEKKRKRKENDEPNEDELDVGNHGLNASSANMSTRFN